MASTTAWMVVGVLLTAGCGKKGAETPVPAEPVPAEPVPAEPAEPAPAEPAPAEPAPTDGAPDAGGGGMCGGIAGLRCAAGSTCVDDPADGCDPAQGGRDCGGKCLSCEDASLNRKYMSRDPNECARMRYMCADGEQAFGDDCGCGCVKKP